MPTVGILVLGSPPPETFLRLLSGGLRALGYVESQNIKFDIRSAELRFI